MKVNLPLTDVERQYSENEVLISETDTKGVITTANASFCEVAGFKEDELVKEAEAAEVARSQPKADQAVLPGMELPAAAPILIPFCTEILPSEGSRSPKRR